MPIDVDAALGAAPTVEQIAWTQRDVLLYHLSLGAGGGAPADPQLAWTYERDLQVLPTFAMVAGQGLSAGDGPPTAMHLPGIDIDLRRILHGGQSLTVHGPIPSAGRATLRTRIADVWDKGSAAIIVLEHEATAEDGTPLWTSSMNIWARGEGGFGGDPGPEVAAETPAREPDRLLDAPTRPDQALFYRLNGDLNPLHIDPGFAQAAGFDRPILHGLASYGIVARVVTDELLDGRADRIAAFDVRFAGVVVPGERLRIAVWEEPEHWLLAVTCADRDDAPVLTHARLEVRP